MYNSNINFSDKAEKINLNDYLKVNNKFVKNSQFETIPKKFSWHIITNEDSEDLKVIKKKITNPPDQYKCGSCWAVTTCTSVSDAFLISKIIDWNPKISYTYALINYPQYQCLGGSPLNLLVAIKENGIPSQNCIDYSWCEKDEKCNTDDSISHFNKNLSHLLPKEKNKCFFKSNKLFFFVKNIKVAVLTENPSKASVYQFRKIIKQHILTTGPCIGGFVVFSNFSKGNFSFTKGIYLENVDYKTNNFSFIQTDADHVKGAHAVSIIGWGEEEDVPIDNDKKCTVQYWICRNSWGSHWGDQQGYFKIAMYPYNKKSQFEKNVFITNREGESFYLGGILLYEPDGLPMKRSMDGMPSDHKILNYIGDERKHYLSLDEDDIINKNLDKKLDFKIYEPKSIKLWFILILIVSFFTIFLLNKKI